MGVQAININGVNGETGHAKNNSRPDKRHNTSNVLFFKKDQF